ncbi:acylphosphatase [Paenarthrobacter sp. NPDC092416]|uniref:acylphosphatase n=1 Tax=Paenarthrobacter sp. NPDC092416 TaxID=3364386 RepID=UPI00380A740D
MSPEIPSDQANIKDRLSATVTGIVQGVGFRYWTARKADRLGLTGTVRNRFDGAVELVAEGSKSDIQDMLSWLKSSHAPGRVEHVESEVSPATGEFSEFRIIG